MSPNQANQVLRHLTVDALDARDYYLERALGLLHQHGHLRAYGLAFGLFPGRTVCAAVGAAQRVIANGIKYGFIIAATDEKTRRRFYAMTRKGADYLAERDPDFKDARATRHTLANLLTRPRVSSDAAPDRKRHMSKWRHREWASMIAIASSCREGTYGLAEHELQNTYWNQLDDAFGRVPDALTLHPDLGRIIWHEVETSRRSRTVGKGRDGKSLHKRLVELPNGNLREKVSGFQSFITLIGRLRSSTSHLVYFGKPCYVSTLVLHYKESVINNELRVLIETTFDVKPDENGSYTLSLSPTSNQRPDDTLYITFNRLPDTPEKAWHNVDPSENPLPFRNCRLKLQLPKELQVKNYEPLPTQTT